MRYFNTYPGLKLSFRLKFRVDYCLVQVRLSLNDFLSRVVGGHFASPSVCCHVVTLDEDHHRILSAIIITCQLSPVSTFFLPVQ